MLLWSLTLSSLTLAWAMTDSGAPANADAPQSRDRLPSAIVQIGGCSGVCIHPAGLILTARHCDLREVERVRFPHCEVVAVRVYECPETEGPLVYDCAGDGYPFAALATVKPEPGDAIFAMGYPDVGGRREFQRLEGVIQGGGEFRFRGGLFVGNLTSLALRPGFSGGPLFNQRAEVIGLADSSDSQSSIFISYAATVGAAQTVLAQHQNRRHLEIELDLQCEECLDFLGDFAHDPYLRDELEEHFEIRLVDFAERDDTAAVAPASRRPLFRVEGSLQAEGYPGKIELLRLLKASGDGPAIKNPPTGVRPADPPAVRGPTPVQTPASESTGADPR